MDYYSHSTKAEPILETLAGCEPTTLACMHGSAWKGDGGALLRELARTLGAGRSPTAAFLFQAFV